MIDPRDLEEGLPDEEFSFLFGFAGLVPRRTLRTKAKKRKGTAAVAAPLPRG